jgi:hypothetical protein
MKISLWLAAALLAGQTCGTAATTMKTVKLETDGGISGRGLGWISIDTGAVEANDTRHTCKGTLTADETKQLDTHVAAANPDVWKSEYAPPDRPHGAPDQMHYTLTLGERTTAWYGEDPPGLPSDLAAFSKALWAVRGRVLGDCKQ